jgi:hypothetical protein
MQHLSNTFPNWWIGHGTTINWPPRSPDLTLLDFYGGWMKSKVYKREVDTQDELLDHIMDVTSCIRVCQDALKQATCHVLTQVANCTDVDSRILKNVLH